MKQTYITRMPDRAGAFLAASRVIRQNGGRLARVSYNKAVDVHTLFIEVEADAPQLSQIEKGLTALGYLAPEPARQVLLLELTLSDAEETTESILEVVSRHNVNISYISAQGARFKLGLPVENPDAVRTLTEELAKLCEVRVLEYEVTEKQLDGTVFYVRFANEMRNLLQLSQEDVNAVLIQSNQLMQTLDERGKIPVQTFDVIRRFAQFFAEHKGENFQAKHTVQPLSGGFRLHRVQPPCGSNIYILENGGTLLFVDSGFACFRNELFALLRTIVPDFDQRRKEMILTHADLDHAGLLDEFDTVYLSRNCYENFRLEQRGEPCFREQDAARAPYSVLSRIISGYRTPSLKNAVVVGAKTDDAPLSRIGSLSALGLDFRLYEGAGGHVRGETVIVCDALQIAFTGDLFVNNQGFSAEQCDFNRIAPYLLTSVNMNSRIAKEIRGQLTEMLSGYAICPGHGEQMG